METVNDGSMIFMSGAVQRLTEALCKTMKPFTEAKKPPKLPENSDQKVTLPPMEPQHQGKALNRAD